MWSQQAYLKTTNTNAADRFGRSVSVTGDSVVIGAIGESSNATGVEGNENDNSAVSSGAAYIFSALTPPLAIQNLIATIIGMGLPSGVANSLSATLKNIDPDNVAAACGKLGAFINKVEAKAKAEQLTVEQTSQLLEAAHSIRTNMGCAP